MADAIGIPVDSKVGKTEATLVKTGLPLPNMIVLDDKVPFSFDKNTVIYLIYLLYKANHITRMDVRNILSIIEQKHPEDVLKYLLEEVKKI